MSVSIDHLPGTLAPDLAALIRQVEAEDGPAVDTTLLAPGMGRSVFERANQRWNADLPAMASVAEIIIPADAALGSAPCPAKLLVPPQAVPGIMLFVHGGGFAFGNPRTHERCARVLAFESRLPVLVPDYRLAPEHPYPAGLEDVVACLRAAFSVTAGLGVEPGALLVAGDSAGANLALAAMLREADAGRALPAGALLFYGVYGADFETPSYRRFKDGPGLTTGKMQRYWDWYVAEARARNHALVAPILADEAALRALPPMHLLAAEIDPLLSDTLHFAERLAGLGRSDHARIVPGVTHGFLQMTNALPAAREALSGAAAAARAMIRPR